MKKTLLTLLCATVITSAQAAEYDYPYLTFKKADGTTTSLDVTNLTITISGTSLVVTNGSGSTTFALSDLSKMYFDSTTGIATLAAEPNGTVEVFAVSGVSMGKYASLKAAQEHLKKGLYIVKSQGKILKISVR